MTLRISYIFFLGYTAHSQPYDAAMDSVGREIEKK